MDSALIFLFLISCWICTALSETLWNRDHLFLVDYHTTPDGCIRNLYRGNLPINSSGDFVYEDLINVMQERAEQASVPFPNDPFNTTKTRLIDYCLLDPSYEMPWINTEFNFFSRQEGAGGFISCPIYGTAVNPYKLISSGVRELATQLDNWLIDPVNTIADLLFELMQSKETQKIHIPTFYWSLPNYINLTIPEGEPCVNILIYFHCHYGNDRTGQTAGSYLLKHGGVVTTNQKSSVSGQPISRTEEVKSFQSVVDINQKISGNHISSRDQRALSWYCYYLFNLGRDLDCSINYDIDSPGSSDWEIAALTLTTFVGIEMLIGVVLFVAVLVFFTRRVVLRSSMEKILPEGMVNHADMTLPDDNDIMF